MAETIELPSFTKQAPTEMTSQILDGIGKLVEALSDEQPQALVHVHSAVTNIIDNTNYAKMAMIEEASSLTDTGEYPRLVCPYDNCETVLNKGMLIWTEIVRKSYNVSARVIDFDESEINVDTDDGEDDVTDLAGYLRCGGCNNPVNVPRGWDLSVE